MSIKTKVVVLYGGKSTEHEISCRSASFVVRNIDRDVYDVAAVGIGHDGCWYLQDLSVLDQASSEALPIEMKANENHQIDNWRNPESYFESLIGGKKPGQKVVCFPVLHGTFGEDGVLQGFLTMMDAAYVGSGVLGSAVGMDKVVAKQLVQAAGIPVVPWLDIRVADYQKNQQLFLDQAEQKLPYPIFVKPACLGSSVGISKTENRDQLAKACELAFSFDEKILLEQGFNVREIECAGLGDYDPEISDPGEITTGEGFYSYEAKYLSENQATIKVPAELDASQAAKAKDLCGKIFKELNLYGLARIDLFLDTDTKQFYFNEANTLPGFTEISQYPLLWKAAGVGASELLDKLIQLGLKRNESEASLSRTFQSGISEE